MDNPISDQCQRNNTKNILTFCANSNNNPMVNTTTEQGMTGEVISGNESPRANETKGYIKETVPKVPKRKIVLTTVYRSKDDFIRSRLF